MIDLTRILSLDYSTILLSEHAEDDTNLTSLDRVEIKALHSYLDSNLLPLVLHSYYSLPANWNYLRPLLAKPLPYPSKLYLPEQVRSNAKDIVDNLESTYWGLGGEVEKEEEEERKRKRLLLETGSDAWKEKQDEELRLRKSTVKKSFGSRKIEEAARKVFAALDKKLSTSSTRYFFSSPTPTSLDIHLSSLLSLLLEVSLPQPILANQLNDSFPTLVAHSKLLQDKSLYTNPPSFIISHSTDTSLIQLFPSLTNLTDLLPSFLNLSSDHTILPTKKKSKETSKTSTELKEEKEFKRKRLMFLGVVVVGVIGWSLGTGAFGLLFSGSAEEEEEGEWEVVEEYVR